MSKPDDLTASTTGVEILLVGIALVGCDHR